MTQLSLNTSVGNWVARHPATSRVFEKWQVDYCCGGGISLEQACWERQLDPGSVLLELEQVLEDTHQEPGDSWLDAGLADLCDHIEQTHHAYLRQELPRLAGLIAKVVGAHGRAHPELYEVQQVFGTLRGELEPHMFKEERILFPAIRALEAARQQAGAPPALPFGSIGMPIHMMEHEHDLAGEALECLRELTAGYQPPPSACNTYRAMLEGLQRLEQDMHRHVHKENQILFPRALALES